MATFTHITKNGANLIAHLDDGTQLMCFNTPAGFWIPSDHVAPTPDPDPPTGAFAWPFSPNLITTEWEGYPGHKGVDWGFAGVGGQNIKAAAAGTVITAGWFSDWREPWGNYVEILHAGAGVGGIDLVTLYAHMRNTPAVIQGQNVTKGQTLGIVGSTGLSTGDHLHWETAVGSVANGNQINPRTFMTQYG